MQNRFSKRAGFHRVSAQILVASYCLFASLVIAQTDPCRDLDGDGYLAGTGCAVQEDCNDLNSAANPFASEVCNGFDDDCDGELDEGCIRTCTDYEVTRTTSVNDRATQGTLATADRSWALSHRDVAVYSPYYISRYSFSGDQLSPPRVYSGTDTIPEVATENLRLVWDGTRMAISWSEGTFSTLHFREIGPWGQSNNAALQLSSPGQGLYSNEALLWNGTEYIADYLRGSLNKYSRFNRISSDSEDQGETILFPSSDHTITWNGDGYSSLQIDTNSQTDIDEVFFRKVSSDGLPLGDAVQISDHSGLPASMHGVSWTLDIVKAGPGQGYGITWSDKRTGRWNIFFARLDEDGQLMTPPGEFQVSQNVDIITDVPRDQDLIWNGHEFMLAWTQNQFALCGDIFLNRFAMDGTQLDERIIIPGFCNLNPKIAWNGKDYGIVYSRHDDYPAGNPDIELAIIGCNCSTDGDSDGVLPCSGGDCDDFDPEVGAGMNEVCDDSKDNDCDGLMDCNDPDCGQGGKDPGLIGGLGFSDKDALFWNTDGNSDDYDIVRGMISDLRDMENYLWSDCFGSRIPGTNFSDIDTPSPGTGWYYQVRGHARTCLIGPWGTVLRDDTIRSCP